MESGMKVNGQYREVDGVWAKVDGVWREVEEITSRSGGSWRQVWNSGYPAPSYVTLPSSISRGAVIQWEVAPVPDAAYEYQFQYNNGPWSNSVFVTDTINTLTVSELTSHYELRIRVRAVDPITGDKQSSWVNSPIRSLTPQMLREPEGFFYSSDITRGDRVVVVWNNESDSIRYTLQVVYTRIEGYKRHITLYDNTGKNYFYAPIPTAPENERVQFRIKASRPGYRDSEWTYGPEVVLQNEKLETPSYIKAPSNYPDQLVNVYWDSVANTENYQLEVQVGDGNWNPLYWGSTASYLYKVTEPVGTAIHFRVRATAAQGYQDSEWATVSMEVLQPPLKKTTWTATSVRSWGSIQGWIDTPRYLTQGSWTAGNHRGLAFFNSASIRETLAGKEIVGVRMYFYRISTSHGYETAQPITLHTHNYTVPPEGTPAISYLIGSIGLWGIGEGRWVDVPLNLIDRFLNGKAKGIAIYRTDGTQYMHMSQNVKIEVTYR